MENTLYSTERIVKTYSAYPDAQKAYDIIRERGYSEDDITLMMSEETKHRYNLSIPTEEAHHTTPLESSGIGSAIGGTLGAVGAAIAAIGTSLLVPGLGLIVAGPLAAALAGAGVGGFAGGIIGALVGAGLDEDEAKYYEEQIRNGGIVVTVKPKTEEDAAYFHTALPA